MTAVIEVRKGCEAELITVHLNREGPCLGEALIHLHLLAYVPYKCDVILHKRTKEEPECDCTQRLILHTICFHYALS